MTGLISDARIAAKVFVGMRGVRTEDKVVMQIPIIKSGPAFYDTPEGCMFTHRDKDVHDAVWEVYKGMPYEDKRVLCFSPKPGRYLLRVQLWERELEPALPPRQYHRPDGKLYTWRLPEELTDQVSVGDRVAVHTQGGIRCVTVAAVERYIPQNGTGRLRMAIRRKGGSVCQ